MLWNFEVERRDSNFLMSRNHWKHLIETYKIIKRHLNGDLLCFFCSLVYNWQIWEWYPLIISVFKKKLSYSFNLFSFLKWENDLCPKSKAPLLFMFLVAMSFLWLHFLCPTRYTFCRAFLTTLNELNDYAGQHEVISENLTSLIITELTRYLQELKTERKSVRAFDIGSLVIFFFSVFDFCFFYSSVPMP